MPGIRVADKGAWELGRWEVSHSTLFRASCFSATLLPGGSSFVEKNLKIEVTIFFFFFFFGGGGNFISFTV